MEARAQAGIELVGTSLRYAEVETYGAEHQKRQGAVGEDPAEGHRLLRLGSCDFDFDVARALRETERNAGAGDAASELAPTERQVATLGEALADVYEQTAAEELRVVVHPSQAFSFFAPAPAETSGREARFRREARLLARPETQQEATEKAAAGGNDLHVETRRLAAGSEASGEDSWFRVLALREGTQERFERVADRLPVPAFRWITSAEAATQVARGAQRQRAADIAGQASGPNRKNGSTLVVGCYPQHLELAFLRGGRLRHALHAPGATLADAAYFAAALLKRLDVAPAAVSDVFTYGLDAGAPADAFATLEQITGVRPQPLALCPLLGLDRDRLAADFDAGPYVPCVGAAL